MTAVKRNKLIALLLVLVILGATVFSATYSWLAGSNVIKSTVDKASILTSYFHTGDGSEGNPFVITRPIHFYNMIYLYQRLEGFADEGYYFQLGYQLLYDEDDAEPDENYYFYRYGDDGKIIAGQYSSVLNMEFYNDGDGMGGALLPVGTSNVPFIGTFDGKGLTVANLHITATETIGNETLGTSDVGVFGYVDETATIKDTYFNGVTIDLTGLDPTVTTADDAHDDTVHDDDKNGTADLAYVGYLAGHIKTSSIVQNVYLNDCHVIGGAAARSGYGFFGCVEKAEGGLVDSLGSEIATLRGEGDNAGFGGSINMMNMYDRLNSVWSNNATTAPTTYVNARTILIDEVNNNEVTVVQPEGTTTMTSYTTNNITFKYRYYSDEDAGKYFYYNRTDMSSTGYGFMCLYGEGTRYPMTVTTYTYKDEFDEDGLLISVGGTYLNTTTTAISAGNVKAEATIWQLDNQGHLNALLEESTRFNTYYLNASANGTLSVSTTATTVWTKTEDQNHEGTLTYTSGGRTWYLSYDGSAWAGYPFDAAYSISNGANYLVQSGSTTLAGTAGNHADWHFENGKLMTFINKTIYYLNASAGTLSLGTNAGSSTTWTKNGNTFTYTDANSRVWYLAYNGGWCCVPFTEGFTIANNTNYLGYNGSAFTSVAAGNALHFSLEGGKLVTFYNNTLYYLNASAGALSLGTNAGSATTWTKNDTTHTLSYTDGNSRTWYLVYDGGWYCVPFTESFTVANGANYLSYNGTAFTASAEGGALHFALEGGKLVTFYNNTLYYLNATGGSLSLGTNAGSATSNWVKGADTLSYTDGNSVTWYLQYANGTWDLFPAPTGYTIRSGALYFGVSGSNLIQTNAAGAATFGVDGSKLLTVINGEINYLVGSTDGSGTLSFTTTRANGTDWTFTLGGGTMSYSGGGQTWYLYDVDDAWKVYPGASVSLISQAGNYLGAASNTTVGADPSSWTVSGGNIYTYYNGATRYLVSNGENVALANSPSDTWTVGATVTNQNGWYLVYDNGWKMTPALSYVLITDGTNYLNRNGTSGVTNGTSEETATKWYPDGNKLYAVNGTTKYYLRGTNTALSVTATAGNGTNFTYDGNNKRLSFTVNTNTYYVVYNDGWTVIQNAQSSSTIKTNSGNNYLNASTTTVSNGTNAGSATQWTYNKSTGKLYCTINSTTYYLKGELAATQTRSTTNLTVTSNASDAGTDWTYENGNFSCQLTVDNADCSYYLVFENSTWKLMDTTKNYYTIRNANNVYLGTDSNATPSLTCVSNNNANNASLWTLSDETVAAKNSYTTTSVTTVINGTTYYLTLGRSSASISTTSSTVRYYTYNSYYFTYYYNGTEYDLYSANGSTWTTSSSNNGNGKKITRTKITFSPENVVFSGVLYLTEESAGAFDATTTTTTVNALNNLAFTASTGTTQTFANVSENVVNTTASVSENVTHTTTAAADRNGLGFETTRRQHIEKTVETNQRGGYQTYFPIRIAVNGETDYDANHPYKVSNKNTGYIISSANIEDSAGESTLQKLAGDIRISYFPISSITGSWSTSGLTVSKIRSGNNYLYLEKDEETETYSIANTTNADEANFWQYSNSKLFTTVGTTKYWLTYDNGLKLSETEGVSWTFSNNNRLAYNNNYIKYTNGAWVATANTADLTLTLGTMNNIYTVDGSGNHTLTDAQKTEAYKQALLQLSQTLAGSDSVYGLHFMDAAISTDHIVTADKAGIFGTEYTDYEFPEDSIDFHVIERGTISFFAGEYFTDNNAFFSLHQVYRYTAKDEIPAGKKVNDIKYIKQISEIYKHATNGDSVNYVYKFTDNTYSNPDGTYTGAVTLADGYSNTAVFKTSWITAPSGLSTTNKRIYYFEIPCNAGEYCLGSVSGKTGAYLIYLDIAANGGEELASAISGTGNDVVTSFQTEFRDAPDTMAHSVILLSYDAPAGSTESTFSVSVNFDKTSASALEDPHPNGLYTIDVLNKTGQDVTLYVYLCDDDFNLLTAFPYAYKVHYTNNTTGSGGTYLETTFGDTFQMMAGFTIPSSGEAIEVSYH